MTPPPVLRVDAAPEASDFYFGNVLGQGSYAKVFHAKMKKNHLEFAVKVMDQSFIRKENKTAFVLTERKVMSRLSHPNIVKFYCSFRPQHDHNVNIIALVVFLLTFVSGDGNRTTTACTWSWSCVAVVTCSALSGAKRSENMKSNLYKVPRYQKQQERGILDAACSFELTQFYTAELVNALEYMHTQRVIHRDIKPDNLLLRYTAFHSSGLALWSELITFIGPNACFYSALIIAITQDQNCESSDVCQFCGTALYVSPEVLHDEPAGRAADLWALGCLVYQMFTGRAPFVAENDYLTFQVIINHSSDQFELPSTVPEIAQDIIRKLLVQNPDERIGAEQNEAGYAALKNHPFFDGVDWDDIGDQTPPYHPPELILPEPRLVRLDINRKYLVT
ncbi:hypothetical protein PsorP6_004702 [Peronosclerospora sorghi]|uniref:Uncharacterized protein n=1 Tax=Peronosclerospora sorghi TaxID=230839 RepID=A0ACC0VIH7_9STRA|nr:hypothetical protein PsorP6_004702 [Peronosclerospora sorghi]